MLNLILRHKIKLAILVFLIILSILSILFDFQISYEDLKVIIENLDIIKDQNYLLSSLLIILIISFLAIIPLPLETWFKIILGHYLAQ